MTDNEIRTAAARGVKLAELARVVGVTMPAIFRFIHGGRSLIRNLDERKCSACGVVAKMRHAPIVLCQSCRTALQSSRTLAALSVRKAIARGELPRPSTFSCVDCGAPASEYEHRDYTAPLSVDPVCRSCNIKRGPARLAA